MFASCRNSNTSVNFVGAQRERYEKQHDRSLIAEQQSHLQRVDTSVKIALEEYSSLSERISAIGTAWAVVSHVLPTKYDFPNAMHLRADSHRVSADSRFHEEGPGRTDELGQCRCPLDQSSLGR